MSAVLSWSCDFCGKGGLVISSAGIIYCQFCHMSYGETMTDKLVEAVKHSERKK